MKVTGLGPIEGFNRPEQTKTVAGEARGSALSSVLSSSPEKSSDKAASRSEAPDSFDRSLRQAQKSDAKRDVRKSEPKKSSPKLSEDKKVDTNQLAPRSEAPVQTVRTDQNTIENESNQPINTDQKTDVKSVAGEPPVGTKAVRMQSTSAKPIAAGRMPSTSASAVMTAEAVAVPSEPAAEAMTQVMADMGQAASEELSVRNLSMREFLTRMQDEFGVDPKSILKAFANLDQKTLAQSPEQTVDAVLSQLNLRPEQMPRAQRLYTQMVQETGQSALNELMIGVSAGATLKVMSEQDLAMQKLQNSITSLNDSFAVRQPESDSSNAALAVPVTAAAVATAQAANAASTTSASAAGAQVAKPATQSLSTDESMDVSQSTDDDDGTMTERSGKSKFASISAALTGATAVVAQPEAKAQADSSAGKSAGQLAQQTSKAKLSSIVEEASAAQPDPAALTATETAPGTDAATATVTSGDFLRAMGQSKPEAAALATSTAIAAPMFQNGSEQPTNVQDIVRQAQLLVKQGGGEMRMQLKPEGIGDVHLKVAVKDGQVAVQMMTETDSAKKALELGLDDLKASLAQHKLHVDALKIEVGSELAKQRFEQSQQDSNREQAKQMAQDFMGQFRQDREAFRQGLQDGAGFRSYQQPNRQGTPEMEPAVAAQKKKAAAASNDSSRRLNLVA